MNTADALEDLGRYAGAFAGATMQNGQFEPFVHSFWSSERIRESDELKAGWQLPTELIPFYGNWHDLICYNQVTGSIVVIDDARQILGQWPTIDDFKERLGIDDPTDVDSPQVTPKFTFNPAFKDDFKP